MHDCLESHLKTYESPVLEVLPHPEPDRGRCGSHEAFKTHRHHFCVFACCAKVVSRFCLEAAATIDASTAATEASVAASGKVDRISDVPGHPPDDDAIVKGATTALVGRANDADCAEMCGKDGVDGDIKNGVDVDANALLKATFSPLRTRFARLSLLAQPEDYRAWNVLKHPRLDGSRELKYAYFILTKHPRSAETFCHLRHLTRRLLRSTTSTSLTTLCLEGFAKCADAASRYHGNYHAWDHRRFLVSLLVEDDEGTGRGIISDDEAAVILQRELDGVKAWQSSRVSDACPFKYRLFLVETRFRRPGLAGGVKFDFFEELVELNRLQAVYAGHETLWNYRRDLMELARKEGGAAFEALLEEDAKFLSGVELTSKNDWEMTLHDRYAKFGASLRDAATAGR